MRLKTFLATFLLFLAVLFSSFGIVSVFMMDTQMNMHLERSAAEFKRISNSLSRDIAVLYGFSQNLEEDLLALLFSYMDHYAQDNVTLFLSPVGLVRTPDATDNLTTVSFESNEYGYFVMATGVLPDPFSFLQLDYLLNISSDVAEIFRIRNILLFICLGLAALTGAILYVILSRIFKPLQVVSKASRKIAQGNYDERIMVSGKNEIATMSEDFNSMADEIEHQFSELRDEAVGKQQFIDNFAHEMRTPLTSIYGYAEYMQRVSLSEEEIIDTAELIKEEAGNMKNMAGSLLTLATLRGYTAEMQELSIGKLFDDVIRALRSQPSIKEMRFEKNAQTDVLYGQEDLIRSLLTNLCNNALDACPEHGGLISLTAKKVNDYIVLSVKDNGFGIPEENLTRLTEPFYRVDKARSRKTGGAGLGLALCRQIAQAHGATLSIKSLEGTGTTVDVVFTYPLQLHDDFNIVPL